jgi:hypothetical protein
MADDVVITDPDLPVVSAGLVTGTGTVDDPLTAPRNLNITFLGQGANHSNTLDNADSFIYDGDVGSYLSTNVWIFQAPVDMMGVAVMIYSDGNADAVGVLSIEPRTPANVAGGVLAGTPTPADLGAAAVPAWGISYWTFTDPVPSGTQFILRLQTTLPADNQTRLIMYALS